MQKKRKKRAKSDQYAWKKANSNVKSKLVKNGQTYYWCTNHNQGAGMWVLHKPEDCRNKRLDDDNDKAGSTDNLANRAIAAMAEYEDDESDSKSSV